MLKQLRVGDVFYDRKNTDAMGDTSLYTVLRAVPHMPLDGSAFFKPHELHWSATVLCTPEQVIVNTVIRADDDGVVIVARA